MSAGDNGVDGLNISLPRIMSGSNQRKGYTLSPSTTDDSHDSHVSNERPSGNGITSHRANETKEGSTLFQRVIPRNPSSATIASPKDSVAASIASTVATVQLVTDAQPILLRDPNDVSPNVDVLNRSQSSDVRRSATVFLINLARALHSYGCPTHRTEILCGRAAFTRGVNCQVAVFPSLIIMSFHGALDNPMDSQSYNFNIDSGLDAAKLQDVDDLALLFAETEMSIGDASEKLTNIVNQPPIYSLWLQLLCFFASSFSSALIFFGGSWIDAALSGVLGLLVGVVLSFETLMKIVDRVAPLLLAALVSFLAHILSDSIGRDRTCPSAIIFSGIVWLLPGLSITSSVAEIAARSYVSGTSRFFYAIIVSLQLGFGIAIGSSISQSSSPCNPDAFSPQGLLPIFVVLCLGSFAIMLNTKPRTIPAAVVAGAVAFTVQYVCSMYSSLAENNSTVLAAFAVGAAGEILGRITHHQPFVIVLNGILVLLPGGMGVRGALSLFQDSAGALQFGLGTLIIAFSITIGLMMVSTLTLPTSKLFKPLQDSNSAASRPTAPPSNPLSSTPSNPPDMQRTGKPSTENYPHVDTLL